MTCMTNDALSREVAFWRDTWQLCLAQSLMDNFVTKEVELLSTHDSASSLIIL
jgi:hypothetical protein